MMQLTARQVRAYKGAAISILMLLMVERRPLTQGEMRRGTAYGDEAINDAVWMLREDGLIVETGRYTWALLGDDARQLPIGATDAIEEKTGDQACLSYEEISELGPDDPELALKELKKETKKETDIDLSLFLNGAGPEIPELPTENSLLDMGFYGKGIEQILAIPGLTMREVRYHVEKAGPGNLGFALARIRKSQAVPESWERAGPEERKKYIVGEFSEFVRH